MISSVRAILCPPPSPIPGPVSSGSRTGSTTAQTWPQQKEREEVAETDLSLSDVSSILYVLGVLISYLQYFGERWKGEVAGGTEDLGEQRCNYHLFNKRLSSAYNIKPYKTQFS